jgi:hypothetical protein
MDLGLINWKCKVNKCSSGGALQALQSLVSRLQEEMLELHTERDHYQVNDFSLAAHVLLVAMKPIFWYSFFLVIFSLEVCFIHVFHYPTFPCRQ